MQDLFMWIITVKRSIHHRRSLAGNRSTLMKSNTILIINPQILLYTVKKYPEGFSFERLY